jgi:hypothetical protein
MLIKSNILLLDVRFENVKIYFVDNFKYLNQILDKDLTLSLYIKRLKGRISRITGFLRRLKDILSFPVRRMLFLALFQSPGIVWHQCRRSDLSLFDKSVFRFYDTHKRCAIFPIALFHFEKSTSLLHSVY